MGRRVDDVQDVHSFDIRLRHLRLMGLEGGNLVLEDAVNLHKDVGGKILCGWAFVEEHISRVPSCRDCCDGKVSMVLMCIILRMNENEIRSDIENHALDALNTLTVQGDGGIRILPPREPGDSKNISGGLLLLSSDAAVAPPAAIRHDQQGNIVPLLCILDERPPTAELDVVRMSTDRENSHGLPFSRRDTEQDYSLFTS